MQLAASRLGTQLAQKLLPLYVVHGDEILLVQEALDQIRHAARAQGFEERVVHTVSGAHFDWSHVLADSKALSLFANRRIIEIRIPSGKPGRQGSPALQELAEHVGPDKLILVQTPRLDKSARSSAWFSALQNAGASVQIDPVEREQLPAWLSQRLAAQQQKFQSGPEGVRALQFFADSVEGHLLAAHQEIMKLGLLYPPGELSLEQIRNAVLNVARYDVFKLSQATLSGQQERAQRMLDGLQAEGQAAVLVHYTLAEDIRALKRLKDATQQGKPLPMALREQRIWGIRERLMERVLPRLSALQLHALLRQAHLVDAIVKGLAQDGWPTDPWQALHRLAQNLCRACRA